MVACALAADTLTTAVYAVSFSGPAISVAKAHTWLCDFLGSTSEVKEIACMDWERNKRIGAGLREKFEDSGLGRRPKKIIQIGDMKEWI